MKRTSVAAVVLVVIILLILGVLMRGSFSEFYFIALYSGYFIAFAAFVAIYLRNPMLDTAAGTPESVLRDLTHRLRSAHYRVSEESARITVQIDSAYSLKLHAKQDKDKTVILYQPDLTPTGWSVVLIVFFFGYGLIAIPIALYYALKSKRFALDQIRPQLPKGGIPRRSEPEADIRTSLIDTLSEGHRLAAEASEATQSNYEDRGLLIGVGSIALWSLSLFLCQLLVPPIEGLPQILVSLAVATIVTIACIVPTSLHVVNDFKPRIENYRSWAARLQRALARETGYYVAEEPERSTFELIAEAYKEVPIWLDARRKGMLFREPGASMLIFVLGYLAFMILLMGFFAIGNNWPLGIGVSLGALGLFSCSFILYFRMRRRVREETLRILAEWRHRLDRMNSRIEKFLQEL